MKRILFGTMLLLSAGLLRAQAVAEVAESNPAEQKTTETLAFRQTEHDFGKIPQNKPVYYSFEIVNTSGAPVKLDNVQASCGCTTPEWSKDPIPPGGTGRIRVGYNAASEGYFEKFITVAYNGNGTKQIKIKGTVWKAPVGPAPSNQGVQFLKQQIQ